MRAAIYARFSTERQRDASITDQFRVCDRFAAQQGFEVVARFGDEGVSGGTAERDGYQTLLAAARRAEFDIIVTEDISRLWRSRAEYGPRSAELEDLGLHLATLCGDDTRRDGWGLVLGIKQAIAESQRREISYRTRRGLEGLALAGKSTGGKCYGYAPGEDAVVREIFDHSAAGLRPSAIARLLNARRVPGPRGPRWSLNAVKRTLANPRYAGWVIWGATRRRMRAQDGRRHGAVMQPEPLVRRHDPARQLVDPATWGTCNPGPAVR